MTIENSSPAEMVTEHDTLRPEAETGAQTPKAKKRKPSKASLKSGKASPKSSGKKRLAKPKPSTDHSAKKKMAAARKRQHAQARPPKKSKRASKKASKPLSKGVKTTSRSGKKITRAKAGGRGVLAKKDMYALVTFIPRSVHAAAWKKVRRLQKKTPNLSLASWLREVIAKAVR